MLDVIEANIEFSLTGTNAVYDITCGCESRRFVFVSMRGYKLHEMCDKLLR